MQVSAQALREATERLAKAGERLEKARELRAASGIELDAASIEFQKAEECLVRRARKLSPEEPVNMGRG